MYLFLIIDLGLIGRVTTLIPGHVILIPTVRNEIFTLLTLCLATATHKLK